MSNLQGLSRNQLTALRSASTGTLDHTAAGWKRPRELKGAATNTIESLAGRGFLLIAGSGGRRTATITDAGRAALRQEDAA